MSSPNPTPEEREQRRELGQFLADNLFNPQGPPTPGQGFRATIETPFASLRSDQKPPVLETEEEQPAEEAESEVEGAKVEEQEEAPDAQGPKVEETDSGEFRVTLSREQKDLLLSVLEGHLGDTEGDPHR